MNCFTLQPYFVKKPYCTTCLIQFNVIIFHTKISFYSLFVLVDYSELLFAFLKAKNLGAHFVDLDFMPIFRLKQQKIK